MQGSPGLWAPAQKIIGDYLNEFRQLVDGVDPDDVSRAVQHLRTARDAGRVVYLAGNGGSAATATHLANDLGKATKQSGRRPMRVVCLSDNVSWLTALANDEGYDRVFSGQLENFAEKGDVLIVISASGNSQNLVEAVELAKSRESVTIGVLGFEGGALKDRVDTCLWVRSRVGAYGPVETAHALLCDLLTTCLIQDSAPGVGASASSGTDP